MIYKTGLQQPQSPLASKIGRKEKWKAPEFSNLPMLCFLPRINNAVDTWIQTPLMVSLMSCTLPSPSHPTNTPTVWAQTWSLRCPSSPPPPLLIVTGAADLRRGQEGSWVPLEAKRSSRSGTARLKQMWSTYRPQLTAQWLRGGHFTSSALQKPPQSCAFSAQSTVLRPWHTLPFSSDRSLSVAVSFFKKNLFPHMCAVVPTHQLARQGWKCKQMCGRQESWEK